MAMNPKIMKWYMHKPTSCAIQSALLKAFYDKGNELRVFTLNQKAFSTKQGWKSITKYYEELAKTFQELGNRDKVIMKYSDDIVAYSKIQLND